MAKRPKKDESMFSDTQKGLAWFISVAFVVLIFVWVLIPPVMKPESMAQLNNLVSTLVTLVVMAFGYFLGASQSSKQNDDAKNEIVDKLTSAPPKGPVAPVPSPPVPTVVVAWWSMLTDTEKAAMTAAAKTDAKIQALIATFAAGKAESADLDALVSAGVLTADRAAILKAA